MSSSIRCYRAGFRASVRRAIQVFVSIISLAALAVACSVPVFRYALEHWQPDPYMAYVFYESELTDEQRAIVDSLMPKSTEGGVVVNVSVTTVDVASNDDPALQKIWDEHSTDKLPAVVMQSPAKWGPPQTIWQGELTQPNVARLLDSPTRKTIGKRLIDGDSVVWVLLESGDQDADDAAYDVLTKEIVKLQGELELPEVEEEDLDDLSVDPDALKIAFSAVRVSRDDPEEQALVEMLLRVESDLRDEDISSQPMAFPVFGRGRALYALVGKGIVPDVIKEASQFLTGACQCTVKAQNPGVDLIMNVDWDGQVVPTEASDEDLPELAGFSGFAADSDDKPAVEGASGGDTETLHAADSTAATKKDVADAVGATAETSKATDLDHRADGAASADVVAPEAGSGTKSTDLSPLPGMGQNVAYVVLFLVVAVVLTTLMFRPKVD